MVTRRVGPQHATPGAVAGFIGRRVRVRISDPVRAENSATADVGFWFASEVTVANTLDPSGLMTGMPIFSWPAGS